jgi:phospholipase/carboxylesterase
MNNLIYEYEPSTESVTKRLYVLVHGKCGNIKVMRPFSRCIPLEAGKLYVQASNIDPEGGFSWWLSEDEFSHSNAINQLYNFILDFAGKHNFKPENITGFGFSQGAAVLSGVIQKNQAILGALALLAGFVIKIQTKGDINHKKIPIFMTHGSGDERIPIELAYIGLKHLESLGHEVVFFEHSLGHKVSVEGMKRLTEWSKNLT